MVGEQRADTVKKRRSALVCTAGVRFTEHHLDFIIGIVVQFTEIVKLSAPSSLYLARFDDMLAEFRKHTARSTRSIQFVITKQQRSFGGVKDRVICA